MPTVMTHAVVGLGLARLFTDRSMPASYWLLAGVLPMLPDLDVIAFSLGIPYGAVLGHRGLSHSLLFALLLGAAVATATFRPYDCDWLTLCGFWFVVVASHGILDAFTNGGLGIAFFAPFDATRYFFPWQPIQVSFLGRAFFSRQALATLASEFLWVWLPTALLLVAVEFIRAGRVGPTP